TAAAIVVVKRLISPITSPIARMASTVSAVGVLVAPAWGPVSLVAFGGWVGEGLALPPPPAKPPPASPAAAPPLVGLRGGRVVCSAMERISLTTSPIRLALVDS